MKLYPIIVSIEIQITNGDDMSGTVRYQCPLNRLPVDDELPGIIEKSLANAPEGFRLMTRHESMMHYIREQKGYQGPTIALPALADGDEWHDPETANVMAFEEEWIEDDEADDQ